MHRCSCTPRASYDRGELTLSAGRREGPEWPNVDLARAEIVDLTHAFDAATPYWPNAASGFELRTIHAGPTPGGWYYSAHAFCAPEHGGTHVDAPIHFAEGREAVDAVTLERLARSSPCGLLR